MCKRSLFVVCLVVASLSPASAYAGSFEVHYAEIKQWVVEPCAEVGAALAVREIDQTDVTVLREMTAQALVLKQESLTRELAAKMSPDSVWTMRRDAYPLLLKLCIERMSNWPK